MLEKYEALEASSLIDLSIFDDWPNFACEKIDPWDCLGVLAYPPHCRDLCCGAFQWTITLYQNEVDYIRINFNCYSADSEPKFQQLNYYVGAIIYIRHIKPFAKSEAGLYSPFGNSDAGKPHYLHRTILALDPTLEELRDFEKVDLFFVGQFLAAFLGSSIFILYQSKSVGYPTACKKRERSTK